MFGFKLNNVLRSSSAANGDDVLNMKQGLNKLGHYEAPAYGMTPYPDTPMFDGMKAFQKRNGLTVDGYARPGGPTEKTLNSHLANTAHDLVQRKDLNQYEYPDKSKRPGKVSTLFAYDPELTDPFYTPKPKVKTAIQKVDWNGRPLRLGGGVGQGQVNRGQDVVGLKNALAWTGHYPVEKAHLGNPTTDEDLNWGLRGFQRDFGLKTDGFSRPGGETEVRLNDLISPLIKRASATTSKFRPDEPTTGANLLMQTGMSTDARTEDAKSGSVQVSDASGYRPSGWQNPTKWALEEAGKQTQGAAEELVGDVKHAANEVGDRVRGGALDAAEGVLRLGADAGRAAGLDNAADNLDHFLDGTGKDRTYSRDKARERPFIREAEQKNQERFVDSLTRDKTVALDDGTTIKYNYRQQLLGLKDGDVRQIVPQKPKGAFGSADRWTRNTSTFDHVLEGNLDEALAFGTNKVSSDIKDGFTASRHGDALTVTGVINHNWNDRYDFDGESSPDPIMNALTDEGRAAEYDSKAAWAQKMTVKFRIVGGDLVQENVEWQDLEPEYGP